MLLYTQLHHREFEPRVSFVSMLSPTSASDSVEKSVDANSIPQDRIAQSQGCLPFFMRGPEDAQDLRYVGPTDPELTSESGAGGNLTINE